MRLQSAQEDAERAEREVLNLKMEVAHLRERLRARVGGDTTAVELEAENATLSAQVADAEQAAAAREMERRALQDAHQKATLNLLKLDRAWKASADELRAAREREEQALAAAARDREALEAQADELDALRAEATRLRADMTKYDQYSRALRQEVAVKKAKLKDTADRERKLRVEYAELDAKLTREQQDKAALKSENEAISQQAKDTELALEETSRQVAELQQQSASDQIENEMLKKQAKDAERALEEGSEQLAALRKTVKELQIENEAAKKAVREAETELLKLQEENDPLSARVASAEKIAEQRARESEGFKSEVSRLKTLLQERDNAISLKLQTIDKLERDVEEQARLVRVTAEHQGEGEVAFAKEMAQVKQREWEKRECEWKLQLQRAQQDASRSNEELARLRTWRVSIQRLLEDDNQLDSNESDDPLVDTVRERLARQREAEEALANAKLDIAKNEDKLTAHMKLLLENEFLRAQVDKTKKVMERVRAMRRASNSPNARVLGSSTSSTPMSETKSTTSTTSATSTTNRRFSSEGIPIGLGGIRSAERREVKIGGKENGKFAPSIAKTHSTVTISAAATTSVPSAASASLSSYTAAVPRAKRKLADMSPSLSSPSWSFSSLLSAAAPSSAVAPKPRASVSTSDSALTSYKRPATASSASTTPTRISASATTSNRATSRSGGSRGDDVGARAKRVFASQYVNVRSRLGR